MVHERAAVRVERQGEAHRVRHHTGLVVLGLDAPHLLDADAVRLRVGADRLAQLQLTDELLRERAVGALGEQRDRSTELHARLVVVLRLAVLVEADVVRDHTLDAALGAVLGRVPDELRAGKAGVDLDAGLFGLLAEPRGDTRQRHDIVAVVRHLRGVRHRDGALLGEEHHLVLRRLLVQRRALFLPVGDELVERARLNHRARQDMIPDLGALLQYHNTDLLALGLGELLDFDRSAQTRGAGTDNEHIDLVNDALLSLGHRVLLLRLLLTESRVAVESARTHRPRRGDRRRARTLRQQRTALRGAELSKSGTLPSGRRACNASELSSQQDHPAFSKLARMRRRARRGRALNRYGRTSIRFPPNHCTAINNPPVASLSRPSASPLTNRGTAAAPRDGGTLKTRAHAAKICTVDLQACRRSPAAVCIAAQAPSTEQHTPTHTRRHNEIVYRIHQISSYHNSYKHHCLAGQWVPKKKYAL